MYTDLELALKPFQEAKANILRHALPKYKITNQEMEIIYSNYVIKHLKLLDEVIESITSTYIHSNRGQNDKERT